MTLVPSPQLTAAVPARQAIVEMDLANGKTMRHHAKAVRGTPENPMTAPEIEAKALDLIGPIIGTAPAEQLIATMRDIEKLHSVRELRPLLQT
jgi:hypothetical protein